MFLFWWEQDIPHATYNSVNYSKQMITLVLTLIIKKDKNIFNYIYS